MLIPFVCALLLLLSHTCPAASPSFRETTQLPFVIHICSFNNKEWVVKNLDSVFMQKYDNYRIIYVDDQSDDGTADIVKQYIEQHDCADKIQLYANTKRNRKMKNMYKTMRECDDNEIIVQVDGDDWLCDDQLLALLNHIYQTQNVWLTYGSYNDYPSGKRGYCEPTPADWVKHKVFRKKKWLYMHPRSFYAWLFKAIKVQDHLTEVVEDHQGVFYPSADDQSSFWPMMEMAGSKFAYLPEITYICNRGNPLSGRVYESPLQKACGGDARQRPVYATLSVPCVNWDRKYAQSTADVIVISHNNAQGASDMIHSLQEHATGLGACALLYTCDKEHAPAYKELETNNPSVRCVKCKLTDVFNKLKKQVQAYSADHLLLVSDKVKVVDDLDIRKYIQDLETTQAYGVYFAYSAHTAPFIHEQTKQPDITQVELYDDLCAWKFACGKYALFNNIDCTLLRRKDVFTRIKHLKTMHDDVNKTIPYNQMWESDIAVDLHGIGLFCTVSPVEGCISQCSITVPMPATLKKHRVSGLSEKSKLLIEKATKKYLKRKEARKKAQKE